MEYFTGDKIFEPLLFVSLLFLPGALFFWVAMKIQPINKLLSHPIDFGLKFRGKRLFGENKTWRSPLAMFFGVLIGFLIAEPLVHKYEYMFEYIERLMDENIFVVAFILSFGSELGELVNSFIKRQRDVKPGVQGGILQHFFDQVDIFIAACILLSVFIQPIPLYFFIWGIVWIWGGHEFFTFVVKKVLKIKT